VEIFAWSIGGGGKPLTLWILLHIFFGIIEHVGPIVSLVDDFVGMGPTPDMFPTVAIVDLLHCPLGFFGSEAPQVWVKVQLVLRLLIQEVSYEYVSGGHVLEFLCFHSIVRHCPIFQIGNDGISPSR